MKHFTATGWCTLAALMVVMLAREAQAAKFQLGGTYGWTNKYDIDYNQWISDYKVKVGDSVRFLNADTNDHTIVQVDKAGYDSCGSAGTVVDDKGTIGSQIYLETTYGEPGDYYYICGNSGHCLQGQKVYIQVLNADGTVSTPPPTVNTTQSDGNSTPASTPGGKSGAPQLPGFSWTSQLMVVVVATFSLVVAAAMTV